MTPATPASSAVEVATPPPTAAVTASRTWASSTTPASGTNHAAPPPEWYAAATEAASRVFPTPPGPVRLSTRCSSMPRSSEAASASRPRNEDR